MSGRRTRWDRIRPAIESPTGWSIRLGLVGPVEVRLHVLIAAWFGLVLVRVGAGPLVGGPARDPLTDALESVAVLAAALLFEAARLAAARRLGVLPLTITLWPLGGLEDLPPRAGWRARVWVAIAGPAALLLAALAGGALLARTTGHLGGIAIPPLFGEPAAGTLTTADGSQPAWLAALFGLQRGVIAVLLLHLVPAAPMAGGRLVEAAIAVRLGRRRAIAAAASVAFVAGGVVLLGAAGLGRGLGVLVGLTAVVGAAGVLTAAPDRRRGDPLLPPGLAGIEPADGDSADGAPDRGRRAGDPGGDRDDEAFAAGLAGLVGLVGPAESFGRPGTGRDGDERPGGDDPLDDTFDDAFDDPRDAPRDAPRDDEVIITPSIDLPLEEPSGVDRSAPRPRPEPSPSESGVAPGPDSDEAGLDRVLAKIAREGLASLDRRERAVLEAATARRLDPDG